MAKVALITGAGKGIGRAAAARLAHDGYHIAAVARTESDLASVQKELGLDNCLIFPADVGHTDTAERCVAEVENRWHQIDLLVNNAGYGVMAPLYKLRVEDWDGMIQTNLRGAFLFTRAVLSGMMNRRDGVIVNVSSIAGKDGFYGGAGYSASKFGMMGLADCLWREVRDYGIRVCTICPGSVDTALHGGGTASVDRSNMMTSEDVADAIAYAARQPERLFVREIELRVTHPKKN
jgi:3-oxoacyl-[acyl-carrier protein] reductase